MATDVLAPVTTPTTPPANGLSQRIDDRVGPRLTIAALWVSTLFVFAYVDLFSLYRPDFRADLDAGKVSAFTVNQGFLLGITTYIAIPSVLIAFTVLAGQRFVRWANIVIAPLYILTIAGSAYREWSYFVLGSAIEVGLLIAVVVVAHRWPRAERAS